MFQPQYLSAASPCSACMTCAGCVGCALCPVAILMAGLAATDMLLNTIHLAT